MTLKIIAVVGELCRAGWNFGGLMGVKSCVKVRKVLSLMAAATATTAA
jgi:hypothetical protein